MLSIDHTCATGSSPLFDKEPGATLERLREIGAFLLPLKKFIPQVSVGSDRLCSLLIIHVPVVQAPYLIKSREPH